MKGKRVVSTFNFIKNIRLCLMDFLLMYNVHMCLTIARVLSLHSVSRFALNSSKVAQHQP